MASGNPPAAQGIVCSSAHFGSFSGLRRATRRRPAFRALPPGTAPAGGAWVIHDRGVREAARGGVLRWQLAPRLTAAALTESSVAIRNSAGVEVAAIFMRGASAIRIVARDVSLRSVTALPRNAWKWRWTHRSRRSPSSFRQGARSRREVRGRWAAPRRGVPGATLRVGIAWPAAVGAGGAVPAGTHTHADLIWWVDVPAPLVRISPAPHRRPAGGRPRGPVDAQVVTTRAAVRQNERFGQYRWALAEAWR